MASSDQGDTMSLPQAARRLGWNYVTAYTRCMAGVLDATQNDAGRWMVKRASVEAQLKRRRVSARVAA